MFLSCWLVSTVIAIIVFPDSPVMAVFLMSPPLAAGVLAGWWRSSERIGERIGGGVLAGLLVGVIIDLGVIAIAVCNWIRLGRIENHENESVGETVGFLVFTVVVGAVLGWVGARLAIILDRYRGGTRRNSDTPQPYLASNATGSGVCNGSGTMSARKVTDMRSELSGEAEAQFQRHAPQ